MNTCPSDLAKMEFYDFIKSPMGQDLYLMLSLPGQPDPNQWDIHLRWWLDSRESVDNKLGRRGDAPDWPVLVMWKSKVFMSIFMDVQKAVAINITMMPLEQLIWNFTALRNILADLHLVNLENLDKPTTFFQKLAVAGMVDLSLG